jgi:hypothetical protein
MGAPFLSPNPYCAGSGGGINQSMHFQSVTTNSNTQALGSLGCGGASSFGQSSNISGNGGGGIYCPNSQKS